MNVKMKLMKIWSEPKNQLVTKHICIILRAVANVLGNLKGLAQDMGNELDRQNKQIERLNYKAQVQNDHIIPINQRIRRQLN